MRCMFCYCFSLFFLYFGGPNSHPVISESSGPIFTKFSGLVEVWEDFIKHVFILDCSRDVAMTTNFVVKFAKMADHTLIRHTGIQK